MVVVVMRVGVVVREYLAYQPDSEAESVIGILIEIVATINQT